MSTPPAAYALPNVSSETTDSRDPELLLPWQAIMRTIAPSGFLHSFEFNEFRATRAQEEFEENALGERSR